MPHIKLILKQSEIWEDVDVEKFHHAFFLDEIIIKGFWSRDIHRNIFRNSKLSVASLYARNIMKIDFGVFPHASNVLYIDVAAKNCCGKIFPIKNRYLL